MDMIIPKGWKLVPVEPTPEMEHAGSLELNGSIGGYEAERLTSAWNAMLAAAPTAPVGEPCPRCKGTGKHVVGPIDCPVISVCKLCKAPAQQPVSDPDGLPEPVGWVKWFGDELNFQPRDALMPEDAKQHGWQLVGLMRSMSAPAPDEREPRLIGYTSQGELENQNERPGPAVTWIAIGNHTIPVYVGGALDAGGAPQ